MKCGTSCAIDIRDIYIELFPNPDVGFGFETSINLDIDFVHQPTSAVGLLTTDGGSV